MSSSIAWVAPIAVALITALGTYLGVTRRLSGRIGTTEASKLWEEASDLREVYQSEISRLRVEIDRIDEELIVCTRAKRQLQLEVDELTVRQRKLELQLEKNSHAAE